MKDSPPVRLQDSGSRSKGFIFFGQLKRERQCHGSSRHRSTTWSSQFLNSDPQTRRAKRCGAAEWHVGFGGRPNTTEPINPHDPTDPRHSALLSQNDSFSALTPSRCGGGMCGARNEPIPSRTGCRFFGYGIHCILPIDTETGSKYFLICNMGFRKDAGLEKMAFRASRKPGQWSMTTRMGRWGAYIYIFRLALIIGPVFVDPWAAPPFLSGQGRAASGTQVCIRE